MKFPPARATPADTRSARTVPVGVATLLLACLPGCGPTAIESVTIAGGDLARGLVAHWPFDEPSGSTTVTDRSGNGHDGQLTGGAWVGAGRFGSGLRLQPGDSVTIPAFPQATPDWTVSVWIKLSATDMAAFTMERAVLLTNERAGMGGWEIEFDPRPGFDWLEASYYVAALNDYVVLTCKCIETDRWLQWTAVFDSSKGRFSLYHNGLLADASSLPAPILPGVPSLDIGRWNQGGRPLSGVIDDFAIWSRALSVDEIATLNARAAPDSR
jgi:concanavalin A-like lectin/glucanase superfamily protein